MHATITKDLGTFAAAHQLENHDGHCARPHGHNYAVSVEVYGPVSTEAGASDEGMVLDFGRITDVWKRRIHPVVDHQDLNDVFDPSRSESGGCWPTTAENIAGWVLRSFIDYGIPATAVHVRETPTSLATVRVEDLDT